VVGIAHHVGRLIEARVAMIVTSDEYLHDMAEVSRIARKIGSPIVLATDCRLCRDLPLSVAVTVGKKMHVMNRWIDRIGILLPPDRRFSLPAQRMVADAGHSARRTFQSASEMESWLGEVLSPPERARLAQFLEEHPGPR
jgi:hypothetical protein